jgi:hypothetical protein
MIIAIFNRTFLCRQEPKDKYIYLSELNPEEEDE